MLRFIIICVATVALFLVAMSAQASSGVPKPRAYDVVSVPCGSIQLPYNVYSMTVGYPATLTMTFQSSGPPESLVTFTANTFQPGGFYYDRTAGNCGSCTLVLHNVVEGPYGPYPHLQLGVDVDGGGCPGSGVTITGFQLQVSPPSASPRR